MADGDLRLPAGREDTAAYVATLAQELKVLVERYDLAALAYLLDLVRAEATQQAYGDVEAHPGTLTGRKNGGNGT